MANRKKATGKKKFTRSGAAAFALGIFLAGPQAAVAAADDAEGPSPASSQGTSAGSESSKANSTAPATRATSGNRVPSTTRASSGRPTPAPSAATAAEPDLSEAAASEPTLPELTATEPMPEAPATGPDLSETPTLPEAAPTEAAPTEAAPTETAPPEPHLPKATTPDATRGAAETTDQPTDSAQKPDPSPGMTTTTQQPTPEPSDSKFIGSPASPETAAYPSAFSVDESSVAAVAVQVAAMKDHSAVFDVRPFELKDEAIAVQIAATVPTSVALPSAPAANAAAASPTPKQPTVTARINSIVDDVFEALSDALAALPEGQLLASLEGALLLVRRNLFNQAPIASPVQEVTTSEGLILGSLAGLDRDGEEITYSVVGDPQFGSISINADGRYIYTPGKDFTGSDSFTVRIATDGSGFNILNPGRHGTTELTVAIGAPAPTNPFAGTAAGLRSVDTTLRLAGASATISVERRLGAFTASIALDNVTAETEVLWRDEAGRSGRLSLTQMTSEYWDEFASAAYGPGGITLGLVYTAADGADQAVILTDVELVRGSEAQIAFTGNLAPTIAGAEGYADDFWDVIGIGFKSMYENFRRQNIDVSNFRPLTLSVTGADLYADTHSLGDFRANRQAEGDAGIRLNLSAAAPSSAVTSTTKFLPAVVTATLSDPGGVVVGLADGSVRQWNGNAWDQLGAVAGAGAVQALVSTQVGLTVVHDYEVSYLRESDRAWINAVALQGAKEKINKVIQTESGIILGIDAAGTTRIMRLTANAQRPIYDQEILGGPTAGFESKLISAVSTKDGIFIALDDATVRQFDGTTWKTLRDDSGFFSDSPVVAMAPFGEGIAIVQRIGILRLWTPDGGWTDNLSDRSGAFSNTTILRQLANGKLLGAGKTGEVVTFDASTGLIKDLLTRKQLAEDLGLDPKEFLVGGGVANVVPYGPGVAVLWKDGTVGQWNGKDTWTLLRSPSGGISSAALTTLGDVLTLTGKINGVNAVRQLLPGRGWVGFPQPFGETDFRNTLDFIKNGGTPFGQGDPLLGRPENRAACETAGTCNGKYYTIEYQTDPVNPFTIGKTWTFGEADTGAAQPSVQVGYDVGLATYGYLFVPEGDWQRANPQYYSLAALKALTTGPSIKLDLATVDELDDRFVFEPDNVDLSSVSVPIPTPIGTLAAEFGLTVGVRLSLDLPKDFGELDWRKQKLIWSYYGTDGTFYSYNTAGSSGFETASFTLPRAFASSSDQVLGISYGVSLTPSLGIAWLLGTPDIPVVGSLNLAKIAAGYENPLSLNYTAGSDRTDPVCQPDCSDLVSVTVAGNAALEVGVLQGLTNSLTLKESWPLFKEEKIITVKEEKIITA